MASNFLSIYASPALKRYNGKALLGAYDIDEEGVPAQDVQLIQDGILKNLLTTRTPVEGLNNNRRGESGITSGSIGSRLKRFKL